MSNKPQGNNGANRPSNLHEDRKLDDTLTRDINHAKHQDLLRSSTKDVTLKETQRVVSPIQDKVPVQKQDKQIQQQKAPVQQQQQQQQQQKKTTQNVVDKSKTSITTQPTAGKPVTYAHRLHGKHTHHLINNLGLDHINLHLLKIPRTLSFLTNNTQQLHKLSQEQRDILCYVNGRYLTRDYHTGKFLWRTPSNYATNQRWLNSLANHFNIKREEQLYDRNSFHRRQVWNAICNEIQSISSYNSILHKIVLTPFEREYQNVRKNAFKALRVLCNSIALFNCPDDKCHTERNNICNIKNPKVTWKLTQCAPRDVCESSMYWMGNNNTKTLSDVERHLQWSYPSPLNMYLCKSIYTPLVLLNHSGTTTFARFCDVLNYTIKNHFNINRSEKLKKLLSTPKNQFDWSYFMKDWKDNKKICALRDRIIDKATTTNGAQTTATTTKDVKKVVKKTPHLKALNNIRPIDRWLIQTCAAQYEHNIKCNKNNATYEPKCCDIRCDKASFNRDIISGAKRVTPIFNAASHALKCYQNARYRSKCLSGTLPEQHTALRNEILRATSVPWMKFFTSPAFKNKINNNVALNALQSKNNLFVIFKEMVLDFIRPLSIARQWVNTNNTITSSSRKCITNKSLTPQQLKLRDERQKQLDIENKRIRDNWCVKDSKGRNCNKVITPNDLIKCKKSLRHVHTWYDDVSLMLRPYLGNVDITNTHSTFTALTNKIANVFGNIFK